MTCLFLFFVVCFTVLSLVVSQANAQIASTPAMGWNSWNHFACNISEGLIRETVDSIVTLGLDKLGYQYVNLDDCWQSHQRDADGKVTPDATRFPNGLKSLSDYVHSKGMKFGIYSSAGFKTCQAYPAALGMEEIDVDSYVEWGVDYLKYDNCFEDHAAPQKRFLPMAQAIKNAERPIYFSLCEWGRENPAAWARQLGGNSWRISGDIRDEWSSITSRAELTASLWRYAGTGGWNDPDMLEVGNGGCTDTEYRTHFSLWAMLKSPLIIGNDVRKMTSTDPAYTILTNKELIAVNQDGLGHQARRIWSSAMADHAATPKLIATKCATGKNGAYEDKPADQKWTVNADGTISNTASGEFLMEFGIDSVTTTKDATKATHWQVGDVDGGLVRSVESGKCLEVNKFNWQLPEWQGKRIQMGICQQSPHNEEKVWDVTEHQAWTLPKGNLFSLYQRQCLTIDRDAPDANLEIWTTDLADGSTVAMFYNKGLMPARMTLTWDMLNWDRAKKVEVRDLWTHQDHLLPASESLSANVESHGVVVLKLK